MSGKAYLEHINIKSFGAFSHEVIGPFGPRLNVVFGRNEAGKTTLASFIGGVLFGWEEARGTRNTYKPRNAERAGSLFFVKKGEAEGEDEQREAEWELTRTRNADGLAGNAALISDIDKETFRTIFSLTSDELRSLRNTTDMTAKLLTAGSGTGASPAQALVDVQSQIAEYTSRSSTIEHSLVRLAARQTELRAQMAHAADEAERYKAQDKEFHELAPQREDLRNRLQRLNDTIELLTVHRTRLQKIDHDVAEWEHQLDELAADEKELRRERGTQPHEVPRHLVRLRASEERVLRDRLEVLSSDEAKCDHAVDLALDNCATSQAAYEVLLESDDVQAMEQKAQSQRRVQIGLSIALPLVFVLVGVPVFMHGREIASLSFTALGICLVVFSVMLAGAAMVMLFRKDKETEALDARKQDAQWVMLQDKKKLEACRENQRRLAGRIEEELNASGLAEAEGSLRRARALLDEAREARTEENLFMQRLQAIMSRRSSAEEKLAAALAEREGIFESIALREDRSITALDELIDQRTRQRNGLLETSERVNSRYGELKQELSQARQRLEFDELKMAYQQVRTRQDECAQDYARLLLAKRMLESAIASWESKSQPEVYRQASRLLSLMTGGRWTKVCMTPEGRLQVVDSVKTTRDPVHLSLGTCQQLYLALRIALLMTADNVGRAIPLLADDILVNFDADRRRGAARALADLAQRRQVILFTCHEEIVETMRIADPSLIEVEL